jgi:hypothetical protein
MHYTQIIYLCDKSPGKGMGLPMSTAKFKELVEFINQQLALSFIPSTERNAYF